MNLWPCFVSFDEAYAARPIGQFAVYWGANDTELYLHLLIGITPTDTSWHCVYNYGAGFAVLPRPVSWRVPGRA